MRNSEKTLTYGTSALKASKKTGSYLQYRYVKQTSSAYNRACIHLVVPMNVMPCHEQVFDKHISYQKVARNTLTTQHAIPTKASLSIHAISQKGTQHTSDTHTKHTFYSAAFALVISLKTFLTRTTKSLIQSFERIVKHLSDKSVVIYDVIYNDARGIPFEHSFDVASAWWGIAFLLASSASLYIALMQ